MLTLIFHLIAYSIKINELEKKRDQIISRLNELEQIKGGN